MKKPIPECEHGNEYKFENKRSLVLFNGENRIYLSRADFKQLVELALKGFE